MKPYIFFIFLWKFNSKDEMMCNGEFMNKDPDEAFDYFDLLAENAQS